MEEIRDAWEGIERCPMRVKDHYYGDGHTAEKIVKHIEEYLNG